MQHVSLVTAVMLLSLSMAQARPWAQEASKQDDIKQLLTLTGARAIGLRTTSQIIARYKVLLPNVPKEVWQVLGKEAEGRIDDFVTKKIVPIYDKHLTHDEIKGLLAFYASPLGQKLLRILPQMSRESLRAGREWGLEFAAAMGKQLDKLGYKVRK